MKVCVAGAGIGGLAAAISIRQAGHEVEVLERTAVLQEVGAGLSIWPNGHRALAALGIRDVPGISTPGVQVRTWRGRLLMEAPIDEFRARYGYDLLLVHRAELHSSLLEMLGRENVRAASEVVAFEQQGSTEVVTQGHAARAQRVYQKTGFITRSIQLWYHYRSSGTR